MTERERAMETAVAAHKAAREALDAFCEGPDFAGPEGAEYARLYRAMADASRVVRELRGPAYVCGSRYCYPRVPANLPESDEHVCGRCGDLMVRAHS